MAAPVPGAEKLHSLVSSGLRDPREAACGHLWRRGGGVLPSMASFLQKKSIAEAVQLAVEHPGRSSGFLMATTQQHCVALLCGEHSAGSMCR